MKLHGKAGDAACLRHRQRQRDEPAGSAFDRLAARVFLCARAYKQSTHQQVDVPVNNSNYKFEARVRLSNTAPTTASAEISNHGGSAQYYNISNDGVWKSICIDNISNDGVWKSICIDNIYVTTGVVDVGFYVDSHGGTSLHIDDVRLT